MKIFIPTNRHHILNEIHPEIRENAIIKDGTNVKCYSAMINECLAECADEDIIVICADRMRPKGEEDLFRMINLINEGYGFVGLYRFGFYALHMDAVRRVGPLDERYIKGTYEDGDYMRRFMEADIAFYETEDIRVVDILSNFNPSNTQLAINHFKNKWDHIDGTCIRLLKEEKYNYNFGEDSGKVFLPWDRSVVFKHSENFKNFKFKDMSK